MPINASKTIMHPSIKNTKYHQKSTQGQANHPENHNITQTIKHTSLQQKQAQTNPTSHSTSSSTNNLQSSKTIRGDHSQTTHANPCPEPTKSPLLLTPPAHNRQSTSPRSSASNCSRNSTISRPLPTFSRPSPRNNYRFHQQTYIPRPHTPEFNNQGPPLLPRPPYQHQDFIPRPYQQHQQPQGHCTQQVFHIHITLPYPPQYCTA